MHIRPHLLAYKGQHIVRYRRDLMKISYSSRWSSMGFFLINYTVLILISWYTHVYIYNISYLKRDFKLVGLQGTKRHKLVNYWANWLQYSLNFNSHFLLSCFFQVTDINKLTHRLANNILLRPGLWAHISEFLSYHFFTC